MLQQDIAGLIHVSLRSLGKTEMYELFIANKNYSSWSLRPWVLMKELGVPFEEKLRNFESEDNFDLFREFSPTGKVPCLVDGETVVWDSLAIAEYLHERHQGVWPPDASARAFARCAAAEMHSGFLPLRNVCPMNCAVTVDLFEMPDDLRRDIERIDELWKEGLEKFGGPFLAGGDFSAADAFFCPVAFRVQSYQLPLSGEAREYCDRLLNLESMRAWHEAGINEPWIEKVHEEEIRAAGKVIADRRSGSGRPAF